MTEGGRRGRVQKPTRGVRTPNAATRARRLTCVVLVGCLFMPLQSAPILAVTTSSPAQPAPGARATIPSSAIDIQRIEQAITVIQTNYHQQVSRSVLEQGCLSALKEPEPGNADPEASRRAIATALARARALRTEGDLSFGSEQCIRGMVGTLNRYSSYLDVRQVRGMRASGSGVAGIGLDLAEAEQGARVVSSLEGTPAERAGLRKGDILTRIDEVDLAGVPLSEVVHLLRGVPRSSVQITLRDGATSEMRRLVLTREVIKRDTLSTRLIEPGLALVRIAEFDTEAMRKLSDGLAELALASGGPLQGIVLDLRASTGGLLPVTVGIAAAFLPEKALVLHTKGRAVDSSLTLLAMPMFYVFPGQKTPYLRLPAETKTARMVVLVSETTASGAEALAGALQDHKRATVVGSNTAGVGFIRTIFTLKGGDGLIVASAGMYRPSGKAIDGTGVAPDVVITEPLDSSTELPDRGGPDFAMEAAIRMLRM